MPNKLTDTEIVKALECCGDEMHFCSVCPYYLQDKENDCCREDLCKDSLDLINRQKAEIERLQAEVTAINNDYDNLMVEKDELFDIAEVEFEEIKAEAYKECVEKAIDEFEQWVGADKCISYSRIKKVLDNLLEELVGDENEGN